MAKLMAVIALIVAVSLLFWCIFVSEGHCKVVNATSSSSLTNVLGLFGLKDTLNLVNCLITCL